MAETQAKHRQEIERTFLKLRIRDSFLGVVLGGVIGISAIIAAVLIAINSNPWAGSLFGAGGITGLVSVFIYGTKSSKNEREKKE
jgi:uncharacterized membrane protein